MNPNADQELFASRLAEYDAALAEGRPRPADSEASIPELESAKQCLDLLEAVWPRATTGDSATRHLSLPKGNSSQDTMHSSGETIAYQAREFGRFQIVRELGRGGAGIVFLARDPTLNREVALKVPRADSLLTPALRRRFVREAETAAQLNHPNIVPIYEAGQVGAICYLVSAYCRGSNLARWLRRRERPVPAPQAALIAAALADGVAHMHSRGILHRDIKPSNVLLEESTTAKPDQEFGRGRTELAIVPRLTDFGLAKMDASELGAADATRTGAILGTPAYMAPEQAEGRLAEIGPATDIYSLGALLYELLTKRTPFQGNSEPDTLRRIVSEEPINPRRLSRGVPRDLETICLKCLHKAASKRYGSARELADDLRRFLGGRPITARRVGAVERTAKSLRRHPFAVLSSSMLVIMGTLVALLWLRPSTHPEEIARQRAVEADRLKWQGKSQLYSATIRKAWEHWREGGLTTLQEVLQASNPAPGERDVRSFEWHYLERLAKGNPTASGELQGPSPSGEAWAVAFSPTDETLAVGYDNEEGGDAETCKAWPASRDAPLVLAGHQGTVMALSYSPDGRLLATAGYDQRVGLWRAADGKHLDWLLGHTAPVRAISFSPDGRYLASAGSDRSIKVWDLRSRTEAASWLAHDQTVRALAFAPDGKRLVSASNDETIAVWDARSYGKLSVFREEHKVACVTYSPDGTLLASGNEAYGVKIRDAQSGKLLSVLKVHTGNVRAVAFSANGQTLASGGNDCLVRLWNVATGEELFTLPTKAPINGLAFDRESRALAAALHDGTVVEWSGDHERALE